MADTTHGQSESTIEALADQCVMCGLCLPHCPTYHLDHHEAESPRGRIVLARQIARGALEPSAGAIAHLDHCLGCLSCQAVCPSGVRYGEILVQTRAMLAPVRDDRRLPRWMTGPRALRRLARLVTVLRAHRWLPPFARWLPGRSLLRRLVSELPATPAATPVFANPHPLPDARGRLTLFPGCAASIFDRDTLAAGRILLEALGYTVVVPAQPVCCGALALHAGDSAAAAETAQATRAAIRDCDATTVLVSASGCLGSLRDHALAGSGSLLVADILGFLAADERLDSLHFRPLALRAALHLPCTQVSVGSGGAPVRALLGRIAGLQVLDLPAQPRCCGAAGSYFIEQAERADRLRAEKLDQAAALAPDLLLTTNIGCRLFLGNGLRQRESEIPVLHPLALLARQLETASP